MAYDLFCSLCGARFHAIRPDKRYCSIRCQSRAGRLRRNKQTDITRAGRDCRICGEHFEIVPPDSNRRYCSDKCARQAAKESRRAFHRKNPTIQTTYNSRRRFKDSGVVARLRRKYPNLPTACQSCGEARIVELAHRPEHRRNGAWRKMENTKPQMIWVLCPTCHNLLDRGICTQAELGLD